MFAFLLNRTIKQEQTAIATPLTELLLKMTPTCDFENDLTATTKMTHAETKSVLSFGDKKSKTVNRVKSILFVLPLQAKYTFVFGSVLLFVSFS